MCKYLKVYKKIIWKTNLKGNKKKCIHAKYLWTLIGKVLLWSFEIIPNCRTTANTWVVRALRFFFSVHSLAYFDSLCLASRRQIEFSDILKVWLNMWPFYFRSHNKLILFNAVDLNNFFLLVEFLFYKLVKLIDDGMKKKRRVHIL